MKIIDLLNKIANGEEVPSKIMYQDKIYYMVGDNDYVNYEYDEDSTLMYAIGNTHNINEEVEIIEDKKIERFKDYIPIGLTTVGADFRKQDVFEALMKIGDKINEIIDRLNKEK